MADRDRDRYQRGGGIKMGTELSRRDFLKFLKMTGIGIGVSVFPRAVSKLCNLSTPKPIDAPATSRPTERPTEAPAPTDTDLPIAKIASPEEISQIMDRYDDDELAQLAIDRKTTKMAGAYFDGAYLIGYKDENDYDYFAIDRGNGLEPLLWAVDQKGNFTLTTVAPADDLTNFEYVFTWNPNVTTPDKKGTIVSYYRYGDQYNPVDYVVLNENSLHEPLNRHARIAPKEVEKPLPAELDEFVKKLEATDYTLGYSKKAGNEKNIVMFYIDPETKAKTEVPEIIINPDGSGAIHKYTFIVEGYDPVEMNVPVTIDELVTGDLEGWRIKNGKVEKQPFISSESAETEFPSFSKAEIMELMQQDAANYPASEMANEQTSARIISGERASDLTGRTPTINYNGFELPTENYTGYVNGIFLYENGKQVKGGIRTMFYAYRAFRNNVQSYVTWIRFDGSQAEFIVDDKLGHSKAFTIRR